MSLVVITDYSFPDTEPERAALERSGARLNAKRCKVRAELIALVCGADAVLTQCARIDAEVIAAMDRAKVIARYGIGVDNVDLDAARARGIPVCNVPDYCIDEVGDHTRALCLDLTRRISRASSHLRTGTWSFPLAVSDVRALSDMAVGVVGFGRIGRAVAARLRGFGCRILVSDPIASAEAVASAGCTLAHFDALLGGSDLITLHCPSTRETKRTRGAAERAPDAAGAPNGERATITDLLLRAMAIALERVPAANCTWQGEGAVAIDRPRVGLVVAHVGGLAIPVLEPTSLARTAGERVRVVACARAGAAPRAQPCASSLSNLGNGCVDAFSAIIPLGQSSILAVGRLAKRPIVIGDALAVRPTLRLTLSADHRVLDGMPAADFLAAILDALEHPDCLA